ncbi:MAG: hypothetical protein IPO66_23740 [Rhodanobacteraceae bacterium]|nr:hypothetical protein [Rhodanobacteraceae bacterium]
MRRFCCALALLLCVRVGLAADSAPSSRLPPDSGPWVVRAYFDRKAQLATVTRRTEPWEVHHDQGFALIEVANRAEYSQLLADQFKLSIDAALTEFIRNPSAGLRSVPGFGCYRTVEETLGSIDQIVATHPTLASAIDIGDSWEKQRNGANGYDLKVLKLSNSAVAGPKPIAFMLGAIHAREYTTAETLMRFAERLLARYPVDADVRWMLDNYELQLLPQANPDGRKKAETGLLWRKNVNENYCGATSNARGADLNRNFPFEWGAHGGSSGNPCDDSFRGAAAVSGAGDGGHRHLPANAVSRPTSAGSHHTSAGGTGRRVSRRPQLWPPGDVALGFRGQRRAQWRRHEDPGTAPRLAQRLPPAARHRAVCHRWRHARFCLWRTRRPGLEFRTRRQLLRVLRQLRSERAGIQYRGTELFAAQYAASLPGSGGTVTGATGERAGGSWRADPTGRRRQ